jgi:hypothetical protein
MQARILAPAHYFGFWLSGCLETRAQPAAGRMEFVHSDERRTDGKIIKNENRSNQMAKRKTNSSAREH